MELINMGVGVVGTVLSVLLGIIAYFLKKLLADFTTLKINVDTAKQNIISNKNSLQNNTVDIIEMKKSNDIHQRDCAGKFNDIDKQMLENIKDITRINTYLEMKK